MLVLSVCLAHDGISGNLNSFFVFLAQYVSLGNAEWDS